MSDMAGRWNGCHAEVDKGFHESVIAHLSLQPVNLIASFFFTCFIILSQQIMCRFIKEAEEDGNKLANEGA